jgi:hypothetical protein
MPPGAPGDGTGTGSPGGLSSGSAASIACHVNLDVCDGKSPTAPMVTEAIASLDPAMTFSVA